MNLQDTDDPMPALYRHFLLVTSLIALFGALTATLIQETRRPVSVNVIDMQGNGTSHCLVDRTCRSRFSPSPAQIG